MAALRKTAVILITALLLFQALPTAAALDSSRSYGFGARWQEVVEGIRVEHRLSAGTTPDGTSSGAMLYDFRYVPFEDGTCCFREISYRRLADVKVTVSRDLAQATVSGKLDGADVTADLIAVGQVRHEVIEHPSPWTSGMDGYDGVQVFISADRYRDAAGTVSVGGTAWSVSGSIYQEMRKAEYSDGQEPKEHVPAPKGPPSSDAGTN